MSMAALWFDYAEGLRYAAQEPLRRCRRVGFRRDVRRGDAVMRAGVRWLVERRTARYLWLRRAW